jgi:hypothetical protein
MKRTLLLAAVSAAPLLALAPVAAFATDTISSSTSTPITTATATNSAPDDIVISTGGSVGVTAAGVAVTLNSSNTVSNAGAIGFTAIDNAVGIQVQGGNTGSVTNSGTITVTDNYTATTDNNTGLIEPPYAQGTNRTGIQVVGPGTFTGAIYNYGSITVHGASSFGVDIQAPITGDYQSLQYTAATSTVAATLLDGSITVVGGEAPTATAAATPGAIGFHIASTGGVGGNVTLGAVSATGYGAQAVVINGAVGGAINLTGAVSATGYETTSRSPYPSIADQYTAAEMQQGGSAVTIGGSVGGGIVISAPPLTAITDASTANDTINGQTILQTSQSTGTITSYGSSPALVIGSATNNLTIGVVNTAANTIQGFSTTDVAGSYGLVIDGTVTGNGLFDQLNYPNLPAPVSATAIQIGSGGSFAAQINGGIYVSGAVSATAYQANATGIHFMSGGSTPLILNDGTIIATSSQENTATTGVAPVNVYGVLIDKGATVTSIVNNSGIIANLTGEGGVGGTVGAIIDRSGSLTNLTNTGTITAQGTQTLITAPMPVTPTAIDMSAGTQYQTITQKQTTNSVFTGSAAYNSTITYSQGQIINYSGLVYQAVTTVGEAIDPLDYPSYWREIGALTPYINGSILMGSGGSNITVNAGIINGTIINLGTGSNNVLTVAGPAGGSLLATSVTGAIEEVSASVAASQVASLGSSQVTSGAQLSGGGNGTLAISVNNGTLTDTNPNVERIGSINVGSNGLLLVAVDPAHGLATQFLTSGASTFATGAALGVSLLSIPTTVSQTYTVVQTTGSGTLTTGTFNNGTVTNAPWLFTATAAYVAPAAPGDSSAIDLTVTRKSAAQIGFNAAEAAALDAVLAAAPNNTGIQTALLSQYTQAGLKTVYDQLLPNQSQGLFDSLDAAVQAVGAMVGTAPEAASRVAGTSLWLQEVNERVDRAGEQTEGSHSKLFGVVGGYEVAGAGGGAAGLTLAYFNANEIDDQSQIGTGTTASMVEASAYYRRTLGRFSMSARAGIGYSWFSDDRVFAASTTINNSTTGTELTARADWGGLFYDGHVQVTYEQPLGRFYVRPEISADYLELNQGHYSETGGGAGFDLNVAAQNSNRLSGQAIMVFGRQWGGASWLRTEVSGGYREVFSGSVGDTTASFSGGNPFTLAPDDDKGGWATVGFALKGGSQYSYLALEGNLDFRQGEQRYDVRIAGKSIF